MSNNDFLDPMRVDNNPPNPKGGYALSGKIMLSAIAVLFFVVVLMVTLHLYARWYLLRARRRQLLRRRSRLYHARRAATHIVFYVDDNNNPTTLIVADPANRGLEPAVLGSLPVFVYSSKTHLETLDCAVCLSEFEENEKGRLLPRCNHAFHIECIDMWFHSHSTCPLCRAPVEPVLEAGRNETDVVVELGEPVGSAAAAAAAAAAETAASSYALCATCQHEEGSSATAATTSLGSRRKGLDLSGVRIEVPMRNEFEPELMLSSPASQGFRSPGTRLLSLQMKRILSMGRKTPTPTGASTTPFGAGTSCGGTELDLERGSLSCPTPG